MRYLGLALFAEGQTDHAFLRPLLRRLCEILCAEEGPAPVVVGDVIELHSPAELHDEDRGSRIYYAAREAVEGTSCSFTRMAQVILKGPGAT